MVAARKLSVNVPTIARFGTGTPEHLGVHDLAPLRPIGTPPAHRSEHGRPRHRTRRRNFGQLAMFRVVPGRPTPCSRRSAMSWKLDLSVLSSKGKRVAPPPPLVLPTGSHGDTSSTMVALTVKSGGDEDLSATQSAAPADATSTSEPNPTAKPDPSSVPAPRFVAPHVATGDGGSLVPGDPGGSLVPGDPGGNGTHHRRWRQLPTFATPTATR